MGSAHSIWTVALWLAGAALLSFLARTFIDYHVVYAGLGVEGRGFAGVTAFNLAFYGAWIGAIVAASHRRRWAMYVLMGFAALLVAFGVFTMTTLCPSPCRTVWPVGEIAIWSNVVIGLAAVGTAAMGLFRKGGSMPAA